MNDNPIGVYDSGFGGLSIWRAIYEALPNESIVYLGDGKNCPYGSRSREEIRQLAGGAVRLLLGRGWKVIVVACNTAAAAAIEYLRAKYPEIPFVGLEPAVKPACLSTGTGVVGVLATERSLEGDLFRRTAARYADKVRILPDRTTRTRAHDSGRRRPDCARLYALSVSDTCNGTCHR